MKVYHPGQRGLQTSFVTPGAHFPNSDFLDANGKPIMFTVVFKEGCAEVSDQVGQYMIDQDLAKASPIMTIEEALA